MPKTIIIAEAGVNHNGNIDIAKKLIEAAADSGADYIKFQTFITENLVSKKAKKADYQAENLNTGKDSGQFEMLKKLELSIRDHNILINHCKKHNIKFLSTGFDLGSLEFLNRIGIDFFKIPSGEITNYPYLKKIASFNKKVIMSTGMANIDEIKKALDVLVYEGLNKSQITILHCNTNYPVPIEEVNLLAMQTN